jgi:hypothetical protein
MPQSLRKIRVRLSILFMDGIIANDRAVALMKKCVLAGKNVIAFGKGIIYQQVPLQ